MIIDNDVIFTCILIIGEQKIFGYKGLNLLFKNMLGIFLFKLLSYML